MTPLEQFLEGVRKIPVLVLVLGGVQLLGLATAGVPIGAGALIVGALACIAASARFLIRPGKTSVQKILLAFQLAGWPLCASLALLGRSIGVAAGLTSTREAEPLLFALVGVALVAAFAALQMVPRAALRTLYAQLGQYRDSGRIGEYELIRILSFGAAGQRFGAVAMVLVGLASTATWIAKLSYSSHSVGVAISSALVFGIAPYLAGILLARLILQRRYLGARDIAIDESGGAPLSLRTL